MSTQQLARKDSIVELFTDTLITLCDDYLTTSHRGPDGLKLKENPEQVHILYLTEKNDSQASGSELENFAGTQDQHEPNSRDKKNKWGIFKNRENFVEMHCG